VGSRFQGLALLERMLYPRAGRGSRNAPALPAVTITTANGEKITGTLTYQDEFSITLVDSGGWNRTWPVAGVKIDADEPLRAHAEQLGRYSDQEIHDVLAFLETLK
jgi:cytochrome c oxidase cbb3-type subunit 3